MLIRASEKALEHARASGKAWKFKLENKSAHFGLSSCSYWHSATQKFNYVPFSGISLIILWNEKFSGGEIAD